VEGCREEKTEVQEEEIKGEIFDSGVDLGQAWV
jgi:hypothetical protein